MKYSKRSTNTRSSTGESEDNSETGIYEGNWKRDMREGFGVMKWSDLSEFTGEWRLD